MAASGRRRRIDTVTTTLFQVEGYELYTRWKDQILADFARRSQRTISFKEKFMGK
ncbi:unnamed protein product, partial [Dovyalis caffra]